MQIYGNIFFSPNPILCILEVAFRLSRHLQLMLAIALVALQHFRAKQTRQKIHILLRVIALNEQAMLLNTKILPAFQF